MTDAKIQIKVGAIEFMGEGDKDWLAAQLDKLLEKVNLSAAHTGGKQQGDGDHNPMAADPAIAGQPLATFLKAHNASRKQVLKFLATAVWLEAKGKKRLTPAEVAKALKESNQTKLANPSDCLNKNVNKGYCEKDGKEFFVTEGGKNSL